MGWDWELGGTDSKESIKNMFLKREEKKHVHSQ